MILIGLLSYPAYSRAPLHGDFEEDFRIKNPKTCPKKISLTYFSSDYLSVTIPIKEYGTHTDAEFVNFRTNSEQTATVDRNNLYGPFAEVKFFKSSKKIKVKERHMIRDYKDGIIWQRIKRRKIRTCIYY